MGPAECRDVQKMEGAAKNASQKCGSGFRASLRSRACRRERGEAKKRSIHDSM
jgi:hypothetical protein